MNQVEGKWPVLGTGIAMIAAFSAVLLMMFKVDPFRANGFEKALFFFSLLVGGWGFFTLTTFFIRRSWSKHLPSLQVFNTSLWYGFWSSFFLIVFLIYQTRPF